MQIPLVSNLKNPRYLLFAAGISFILFDISFYLMSTLPGTRHNACVEGANLTINNIIFSLFVSGLMGIIISGYLKLFKDKHKEKNIAATSLSGIGFIISGLTLFCGICTIPFLSIFGLATIAHFFTDYNLQFQIISIVLLLFSAYLLNRQLAKQCGLFCKIKDVIK